MSYGGQSGSSATSSSAAQLPEHCPPSPANRSACRRLTSRKNAAVNVQATDSPRNTASLPHRRHAGRGSREPSAGALRRGSKVERECLDDCKKRKKNRRISNGARCTPRVLHAVEYEMPSFDIEPAPGRDLADARRARGYEIRRPRGASDATYLIHAAGDELLMQAAAQRPPAGTSSYRVPALDALDAGTLSVRLQAAGGWRRGAPAGRFGWRDAPVAGNFARRAVETYCYAFAAPDFLESEQQQLYWRTDIVQMTHWPTMLEAARARHIGCAASTRVSGVDPRRAAPMAASPQTARRCEIERPRQRGERQRSRFFPDPARSQAVAS